MSTENDQLIDHRAVDQDLGGSSELVRLLLNSTGEGIYGVDLKGNCTFANPACLALLGFDSDTDLLGKQMHKLIHHTRPNGEAYPVEECRIYKALWDRAGTHVDDEVMWCADGRSFPAEYWSYPVERDGELVGCVVTFTDITERVHAQNELMEAEERVRLLLNSTGEGIYGIDLEGNCTFANPACVQLLGFESDKELLGEHMHRLVHHTRPNGDAYPVEECRIYQALWERKGTHVADEVMFRADGTRFPSEYRSYPVERDGELVGCVVTFVDISEKLQVEEELRQTEKMAALGKLSAGLAHELNNPAAAAGRASSQLLEALSELQKATVELTKVDLTPELWDSLIEWCHQLEERSTEAVELSPLEASDREQGLLDRLSAHGVDDGWDMAAVLVKSGVEADELDRIASALPAETVGQAIGWLCKSLTTADLASAVAQSARSISTLVDAVKSYSYMDQAPVQLVDVHQGIEDTLTMLGSKLTDGVQIEREYDRDIPRVEVRGSELNQVWMNLIDNALDAIDGVGTVTIRTYLEGNHLAVEIVDNGPGIDPEVQPRIFDPFFTTKDVGQGTGLGLDVARRIVTVRCDGELGFRCYPGETVFWVHLPVS
ncbi:MAG: PAS domain S-box protein [Dehalococcoidia bacterium]